MTVDRRFLVKLAGLFCLVTLVSAWAVVPCAHAFGPENVTVWNWISTTRCTASAVGDVDGDQAAEIVTGGDYYDDTRYVAQLCVWDGSTLALENVKTWYWTSYTEINTVAVGDVDGDQSVEIITGGDYSDGIRYVAQLCTWSGSTLALEQVTAWYWTSNTVIRSVAIGDVDGDQSVEIVTGGDYSDGQLAVAQLCVWSGSNLALEQVTTWYWTSNTYISSVAVGDWDGDQAAEIVTGGYYWDGSHFVAQLCVWEGSTLALEQVTAWYWGPQTFIYSVAVGDVDGDGSSEIVTGGSYYDGDRHVYNSQLCTWSGSTLALEQVRTWHWISDTEIYSVAIGDVDGDQSVEIVTGGSYYDDANHYGAQLCVWSGSLLQVIMWRSAGDSYIVSVAIGEVDGDGSVEIVTGGSYLSGGIYVAELAVWGTT